MRLSAKDILRNGFKVIVPAIVGGLIVQFLVPVIQDLFARPDVAITSPIKGEEVEWSLAGHLVIGTSRKVGDLHLYVLVHPLPTDMWWVQRTPTILDGGNWQAIVYFGENFVGAGDQYELCAIITDKILQEGQALQLDDFPSYVARDVITVTRVITYDHHTWSVTQKGSVVEIAYGKGTYFPQYAALHLNDSYFRMVYGPESVWGTSVTLLPSFWAGGDYYQGASISCAWEVVGSELVLSITGTISDLSVSEEIRISPPSDNSISAVVSVDVDGDVDLDARPGEAFKLVMLSSMHISENVWDAQSAYVGAQSIPLPVSGWILQPPVEHSTFGLMGGTSNWKVNAPTIEVNLDRTAQVTGWVTPSTDPNNDDVGFWAASDQITRSWQYTIIAKP